MKYYLKIIKKISVKGLIVHVIGLVVSMLIIWSVSYLILVTFSIQDSNVSIQNEAIEQLVIEKKVPATTTKATSSKAVTKEK